jgi:predicted dehydrogenase
MKPNDASRGLRVRWAVAGTGGIARAFVSDLALVPGAELVAVGSRSQQRALEFVRVHGPATAYGSYAGLLADPRADIVYVATPTRQHYAIALEAIRQGKAVLVEKAFTATLAGAAEIVSEARRRRTFAMEAMWTRFQPAIVRAQQLLADGAIGEIVAVQADLGIARAFDPSDKAFAPELGGGSLLDLGAYVVSFAQMILGKPQSVSVVGAIEPNGVESSVSILLGWPNGSSAVLTTSLHSPMPGAARIFGSRGWLEFPPVFLHPHGFVLHREGRQSDAISLPPIGLGYAHEFIEAGDCIRAGMEESTVMPLEDTLSVMAVLDEAAVQLGITRTEDREVLSPGGDPGGL